MTNPQHETTPGATAGLPGENAAPQNAELSDDERADTVAMGGVASPQEERDAQDLEGVIGDE